MTFNRRAVERTLNYIREHRNHVVKWPELLLLDGKYSYPNDLVWRLRSGSFSRSSGDLVGTAILANPDVFCEVYEMTPRNGPHQRIFWRTAHLLLGEPEEKSGILSSRWRWPAEYRDDSQFWEWEDYPEDSKEIVVTVLKRALSEESMEFMWRHEKTIPERAKELGWGGDWLLSEKELMDKVRCDSYS